MSFQVVSLSPNRPRLWTIHKDTMRDDTEKESDDETCVERVPIKRVPAQPQYYQDHSDRRDEMKKFFTMKNTRGDDIQNKPRLTLRVLDRLPRYNSRKLLAHAPTHGLPVSPKPSHKQPQRRMSDQSNSTQDSKYVMVPGCKVLSQPIGFVDLVGKTASSCCFRSSPRKSILKTAERKHNENLGSRQHKRMASFATNVLTNDVWVMTRQISRHDSESLWWTEEDFNDRQEQHEVIASYIEAQYSPLLNQAYKSTKATRLDISDLSPEMVDLDVKSVILCSVARGLESFVIPDLKEMILKTHYQAVFTQQHVMSGNSESIAKVSLEYSRPSRLVALKMAHIDALQTELNSQESQEAGQGRASFIFQSKRCHAMEQQKDVHGMQHQKNVQ